MMRLIFKKRPYKFYSFSLTIGFLSFFLLPTYHYSHNGPKYLLFFIRKFKDHKCSKVPELDFSKILLNGPQNEFKTVP